MHATFNEIRKALHLPKKEHIIGFDRRTGLTEGIMVPSEGNRRKTFIEREKEQGYVRNYYPERMMFIEINKKTGVMAKYVFNPSEMITLLKTDPLKAKLFYLYNLDLFVTGEAPYNAKQLAELFKMDEKEVICQIVDAERAVAPLTVLKGNEAGSVPSF